ncbi:MAG: LysR family transcriptional regulator [Myxococcales bacterium]|nr:LysR family transcriptional regulator [Myxococcales bacterium]
MDKLAAMRTFVEIVDRGSLSAAATTLERSNPTVVRALAALEAELGVVLLRRTTRRMSLTEEGRVYLDRCRRILADVAEAEELVGQGRSEPRGELRITAPVRFGQMHVNPLVIEFLRRHPRIRIELILLDRVVDLVEEGIDAAVRIGPLADSSMIAVPVGRMRRVVCASPKLLRKSGTPKHPRELEQRPCLRFRDLAGGHWRFVEDGSELSVSVRGNFASNQAVAALQACEAGLGFGLFLHYQVAPALREGRLRVVLRAFELPAVPVSLVYAEARLMSPRLRAFLDWMKLRLPESVELG